MIEPLINSVSGVKRIEDRKLEEISAVQKIKKTAEVKLPDDWWYSVSTFEVLIPKKSSPVYRLTQTTSPYKHNEAGVQAERIKRLPRTKYWEIRQGDYRSKAEESKMLNRRKNKARNELIGLSLTTIFSTILVIIISYLIARAV